MPTTRMRLRQLTNKRETNDRLIPLINVVFLMLIFFLLAGSIRPPVPFDIRLPISQSEQIRTKESLVVMVGADGQISIEGKLLEGERAEGLRDVLAAQWAAIESTANLQLRKVEIRADQMLPVAKLSLILSAISGAGADEISLITQR